MVSALCRLKNGLGEMGIAPHSIHHVMSEMRESKAEERERERRARDTIA